VKVLLRNPRREIDIQGARTVHRLLDELDLNREAHLVIRNGELVPGDGRLADGDVVEVRPVISGGAVGGPRRAGDGSDRS
jgi:sulfur carrier protein